MSGGTPSTVDDMAGDDRLCAWHFASEEHPSSLQVAEWDLGGRENRVLGKVPLKGAKVLILGASDGHLAYWCEQLGAGEVLAAERSLIDPLDLFPLSTGNEPGVRRLERLHAARIRRSFWFSHAHQASSVQAVERGPYEISSDEGSFDIAIMGWALDSLADPFHALACAARESQDWIVIPLPIRGRDATHVVTSTLLKTRSRRAVFIPRAKTGDRKHQWWALDPGVVEEAVEMMGFRAQARHLTLARHRGRHHLICTVTARRVAEPAVT